MCEIILNYHKNDLHNERPSVGRGLILLSLSPFTKAQ